MTIGDGYEYVCEGVIGERSKCTICTKPLVDPVSTKCEPKPHIFCRSCIKEQLGRYSSCSLCCQELRTEDLISVTDNTLLDSLDKIPVKCVHCKTDLERGKFNHHKTETCPKTNVSCQASDIKCSWIGPRDQLEEHLNTCRFNLLRPMITQLQNEDQRLTNQVNHHRTQIERLAKENQYLKYQMEQSESMWIYHFLKSLLILLFELCNNRFILLKEHISFCLERQQLFESMYMESLLCSKADNKMSRWKRASSHMKSFISKKRKRDEHQ